ncbi:MAG: peptidase domain-containing ABC transporter [Chloroflexi bacterium]|nr:peptidase domain-containing ABC transporter [Chloroflexota bacterium]
MSTQTKYFTFLTRRASWISLVGFLKGQRRRVPVELQLSIVECGAACLAMILSYYGRRTHTAECREAIGVGRDGISARSITQAGRAYGLRVKAYSIEPDQFNLIPLPAIAHWKFNHFIVVERWTSNKIWIVDPAKGRQVLDADEFDSAFTGVVLTFERGIHFEKRRIAARAMSWRTYLARLVALPGIARFLIQVLVASLLLQLIGLILPGFTKILVDDILPNQLDHFMTILGVGLVLIILAQVLLQYLRSVLLIYLQARLDAQLMLGFFEHVLSLPFRFFQQRTSGDMLMRLSSNTVIRETLTNQTISVILDGSFVLVYLSILLNQNLIFGLVVMGVASLQMLILLFTARRIHNLTESGLTTQAESQSYLVEALSGISLLKASGTEDRALDHWSSLFFKDLEASLKKRHLSSLINVATSSLQTFTPLLLLWVGIHYVLIGEMSLGTMLALNTIAVSFLAPLGSLVNTAQQLQLVSAHLGRITDIVEAKPEQDVRSVTPAPELQGQIELHNVSFRYDPNTPWALENISITIKPGQKVAIVGPTGSGKSTLAKLALGFYPPTEGEILYDGHLLSRMNYQTVRSQFGVVLQETILFSNSVRDNIAFNNPDLSLPQIIEVAQKACLHEDIMRMPMGYETQIAEGGAGLSGGQRQRLALARALANNPAILLLDEATSHLDVQTEDQVDRNLNALSCTRLVIAHRLSTVRNADLILVLLGGHIVERGTHDELVRQGGYYAAMVAQQVGE